MLTSCRVTVGLLLLGVYLCSASYLRLDETNLVSFCCCDEPKCPPVDIQKAYGPPPAPYVCDCSRPDEVPDCRCGNEVGRLPMSSTCGLPDCSKSQSPVTRILDPRPVVPARSLTKKFNLPSGPPNPVRPLNARECRPNVAGVGPGNCVRGLDSDECGGKKRTCSNEKNFNKGFVAVKLTTESKPEDSPEDCGHSLPASQGLAPSQTDGAGNQAATLVTVKDKCGRTKTMHPSDVVTVAPVVMGPGGSTVDVQQPQSSSASMSASASDSMIGSIIGAIQQKASQSSQSGSSVPASMQSNAASSSVQSTVQSAIQQMLSASISAIQSVASQSAAAGGGGLPAPASSGSALTPTSSAAPSSGAPAGKPAAPASQFSLGSLASGSSLSLPR